MKHRYEYSIAEVCERLHMGMNGSSDALTDDEEKDLVETLKHRLATWEPTRWEPSSRYDAVYRELITATLAEYNAWKNSLAQPQGCSLEDY